MPRRDKINYYLDIAETVSQRSTCIRSRYGAIIVKNDEILSTGYSGAPRGRRNCVDIGTCLRKDLKIPHGERYEMCRAVHAEANAIISVARRDSIGATLYLVGVDATTGDYVNSTDACAMCKRMIINAGIQTVFIRINNTQYRVVDVEAEWVAEDDPKLNR